MDLVVFRETVSGTLATTTGIQVLRVVLVWVVTVTARWKP
jgi:hypothetical protein